MTVMTLYIIVAILAIELGIDNICIKIKYFIELNYYKIK